MKIKGNKSDFSMIVSFVLPAFTRAPQGGYKVVFEYANRFVERGHTVKVLFINDEILPSLPNVHFVKKNLGNALTRRGPRWFTLDKSVKCISSLEKGAIDDAADANVIIATAVETVATVKKMDKNTKKMYFIQDHEDWNVSAEYLNSTYALGFDIIVIAEWLKNIVDKYSQSPSIVVKNPVDINMYKVYKPIEKRPKHSISMLYHQNEHKGIKYALEALYKLREKYEDLTVEMFGIFQKPEGFPEWIHYCKDASPEQTVEIYNSTCVFVCASVKEGYGLTGLEAMACGAALVSTDYQGVHEYAIDGVNALLSPVKDVDVLVANVSKLFDNDELRYQISEAGVKSVQKDFSWDVAVDKFEKAIMK